MTVPGHDSPDAVGDGHTFLEPGITSLTAVEIRNRLNHLTVSLLPATLLFGHGTPAALADHLRSQLPPGAASSARDQDAPTGTGAVGNPTAAPAGAGGEGSSCSVCCSSS